MTSDSWTCDGIPKNGKQYPEFEPHEQHEPELNYSSDCAICGLPKEAMDKPSGTFPAKSILIASVIGGVILAGGAIAYSLLAPGCEPGLQKIDTQCVDPYLQPYQEAKKQGDEAVNLAENYTTIEDLEKAQKILAVVFEQLNQIPQDALIFSQAQTQLQAYKSEPVKIDANLQKEQKAQEQLTAAQKIAQQAEKQTESAESTSELNNAKQRWQEAKTQLEAIASNTLLASQVQQLQTEYNHKITEIDNRIASLTRQSPPRPVPQMTRPRVAPKPKSKPRPKYTPKPAAKPSDPCAVQNPPPNCLF